MTDHDRVCHRQFVFTIPKRFRLYFRYDRKLLGDLCQVAWPDFHGSEGGNSKTPVNPDFFLLGLPHTPELLNLDFHRFIRFDSGRRLLGQLHSHSCQKEF